MKKRSKKIKSKRNIGPLSYLEMGGVKFDEGDYVGAIQCYNNALKGKPSDASVHILLAQAYIKLGHWERALREYDKAIEYEPDYYSNYIERAWAKFMLMDYPGAVGDCNRAIDIQPDFALSYRVRGIVYLVGMRDHKRAVDDFNIYLKHEVNDALILAYRAEAKICIGDFTGGKKDALRVIKLNPDMWEGYYSLGIYYYYREEYAKALEYLRKALKINPDNEAVWMNCERILAIMMRDVPLEEQQN